MVLGSPIDLSFEIVPDEGTDLASSCVSAELVSGDVPVSSAKVRVVPLPEIPGRPAAVRVQAFVVADEPVLTATLTAGCSGRVSRSYTFLAQLPETVASTSAPLDIARLSTVAAVPSASAGTAALGSGARQLAAPVQRAQQAPAAVAQAPIPAAPQPKPKPRKAAAPAAAVAKAAPVVGKATEAKPPAASAPQPAPRSRLVMEPIEAAAQTPAALRSTSELAAQPAQTPASGRAQAAAAWKALNGEPQGDAPQEQERQERVRELEAQVAAMKAQVAKERSGMADLRERLESIEADRYSSTVVYMLALALALAVGVAAWMWKRMQRDHAKAEQAWRDSVALMSAHDKEVAEHLLVPHPSDTWDDEDTTLPPIEPAAPVSAPMPATAPMADAPVPAPAPATKVAAVAPPAAEAARAVHIVNPEELFDILQQAEFFISVGEHDQAIGALTQHIADRGKTSPFAYLELLRLYHQLGRAEEFERLRAQFLRHFNADLPAFSRFRQQGKGLDHYTDALAEIEAQWTSPSILALLEGYLFHEEGQRASMPPFDLAAYDDLLLLLAIAQTTPASARGAPPPRKRTTPLGPPAAPITPEVQPVDDWGQASTERPETLMERSLDSLIGDLELAPQTAPALAERPLSEAMLDIDLTEPPPITISDLPAVPVTAPPASGQPVGFGLSDDKYELRFELEPRESKPKS